ncbi:MAG: FkbM family methyltransferase [Solirubrobacteraceae bacterium]
MFCRIADPGALEGRFIQAEVVLGRGNLDLELRLATSGTWTLLFSQAERTHHGPLLREFDRCLATAEGVIDIGANAGIYTYWFAANRPPGCRLVAVEPLPELASQLRKNLEANGVSGCDVIEAVLTDSPGERVFHVGTTDSVSSLHADHVGRHGGSSRSIAVRGTTLDEMVASTAIKPSLLKIDVEDHELAVLRGGQDVIRRFRPAILVEVTPGTAFDVHRLLSGYGYEGLRFASDGSLSTINEPLVPPGHAFTDVLYQVSRYG